MNKPAITTSKKITSAGAAVGEVGKEIVAVKNELVLYNTNKRDLIPYNTNQNALVTYNTNKNTLEAAMKELEESQPGTVPFGSDVLKAAFALVSHMTNDPDGIRLDTCVTWCKWLHTLKLPHDNMTVISHYSGESCPMLNRMIARCTDLDKYNVYVLENWDCRAAAEVPTRLTIIVTKPDTPKNECEQETVEQDLKSCSQLSCSNCRKNLHKVNEWTDSVKTTKLSVDKVHSNNNNLVVCNSIALDLNVCTEGCLVPFDQMSGLYSIIISSMQYANTLAHGFSSVLLVYLSILVGLVAVFHTFMASIRDTYNLTYYSCTTYIVYGIIVSEILLFATFF